MEYQSIDAAVDDDWINEAVINRKRKLAYLDLSPICKKFGYRSNNDKMTKMTGRIGMRFCFHLF